MTMPGLHDVRWQPYDPDHLVEHSLLPARRLLVFGEQGTGKSQLCSALATALERRGHACQCISADPGSPLFGVPGAINLGQWQPDGWRTIRTEALCTLDAARFRLPLCQAVGRLAAAADRLQSLLIDAPGLTRGIAAAELLPALADAAAIEAVIVLGGGDLPLSDELNALPCPVTAVHAAPAARQPTSAERRAGRTRLWDTHLARADRRTLDLGQWRCVGTPPPAYADEAWPGRQIAVLDRGRTVAMGEVLSRSGDRIELRLDGKANGDALLVRNALRHANGQLGTAVPLPTGAQTPTTDPPPAVLADSKEPLSFRCGRLAATLHNGVFGDPMLEIAFTDRRRRLLFDLGEVGHLSPRLAHRISDVFFSHAHFDHIGGFPWLLRARLIPLPACRLYGPPGLAGHVAHWIGGVRWDRIGDQAPEFVIHEVQGDRLERYRIVTGRSLECLDSRELHDDTLLDEPGLRVRTVTLDHGIPVLAFALDQADEWHVRRDALAGFGEAGGPWLADLKQAVARRETERTLTLPSGRTVSAGALADTLLRREPGERLVYATDFANTDANRRRLVELARGADTLMCEASFLAQDADQARATHHLTAGACGEIAAQAGVRQLVPFHFSRRYKSDPARVYQEIEAAFGDVVKR